MHRIFKSAFILIPILCTSVAAQTLYWQTGTRDAVLKGEFKNASVDSSGRISSAPPIVAGFKTGEQFSWSGATDASGNFYLGTGGEGKLFKIDKSGKGSLLFDSNEINVSAVAIGPDQSVYAGTSPDGKVYKIGRDGKASVYFDPKQTYVWSLAIGNDGALYVGTGETGRIYKVTSAGADAEASLFFDSSETHITALAVDSNGDLIAGTDSEGIVFRIGKDKKAFALLDSPLREIHELAVAQDGTIYALALSESAAKPAESASASSGPETVKVEIPDPTAPATSPTPEKSRYEVSDAKSVIYKIDKGGGVGVLWNSPSETVFSIAADTNGVIAGTSGKGRIYRIQENADAVLLGESDDEQVSVIRKDGAGFVAATSNQAGTFRFGSGNAGEGSYTSPVLDAQTGAKWGRIYSSKTGSVRFETRAGNTAVPGESWSGWQAATGADDVIGSPGARYLQWRAIISGGASLVSTQVSFALLNIAPEVLSIEILPPNVGLASNPEIPVDPNVEALGLNPADFGVAVVAAPPRRVFQFGARSFQWKAEDRNKDVLKYRVYLRKEGDNVFRQIGMAQTDDYLTLDGRTLEDGVYTLRIEAMDSGSRTQSETLSGSRTSEPFVIDNTAPTLEMAGQTILRDGKLSMKVRAIEKVGYVAKAEYSVDGGQWKPAFADDGIFDGSLESITIEALVGADSPSIVTLRVFDSSGNYSVIRSR
ncbi:MAG: hypothetical protein R2684_01315 [Pyrinomonadaceae bacterium]